MNKGASPSHSRLFGIRLATSAVFEMKFAQLNDDVLFGEVWAREEQLPLPDRRIVTVVALMAQGLADSSFRYHLETAKKDGVTGEEMAEILDPYGVKTGPAPPKPGCLSRCQRGGRSNSRFLKQVKRYVPAYNRSSNGLEINLAGPWPRQNMSPSGCGAVSRIFSVIRRFQTMPKLRKMLGAADSPYIVSLMRLIETQSKTTIVAWCLDYAEEHILPIYVQTFPQDGRPRLALTAARDWMAGRLKLPEVKRIILQECHAAAREAEAYPAAQAAARTCGQAAACIHTPTHSLGLAFYGAAAIAYDRVGINEKPDVYDRIAAEECAKMEAALRRIAVENEPHPAKINWHC